jgi:hypothetical protein
MRSDRDWALQLALRGTDMTNSPRPYRNAWEYLTEVGLAFILVIAGIVLAGVISEPFRDLFDVAYPIGLCIGMAPAWWYTRRCQVHGFDWYDYASFFVFMILVDLIRSAIAGANQRLIESIVVAVAFGCYLAGWQWVRRKLRHDGRDVPATNEASGESGRDRQ